jgi:hypothetical protein
MAIGPDDCVIHLNKVRKLVPGRDAFGRPTDVYQYPVYWDKFQKYASAKTDWSTGWNAEEAVIKAELKKFNAVYKQTKKGGEYLKFRSNSDMLMFMLKWS